MSADVNNDFFEVKNGRTYLRVKVTTKASKNAITGVKNNELLVSVTSVPEHGKANEAVIKLLSKLLKCAKTKLDLVSGDKSRNKLFRIDEILDFSKFMQSVDVKKVKRRGELR